MGALHTHMASHIWQYRFILIMHFPAYLLTSNGTSAPSCPIPNNHLHAPQVLSSSQSPGPASQPFPLKLIDKIKSGQFVLRREHLSDNIALTQKLEDVRGYTLGATGPRLREVSSLFTRCYCFLGYMAFLTPDPGNQLTYARLIIREALRWRDHDRAFQGCGLLRPTLLPGLQAATSPGYGGRDQHCVPCAGALTAHDPSLLALPIATVEWGHSTECRHQCQTQRLHVLEQRSLHLLI